MKKVLLLAVALFVGGVASAQKLEFGIKGGVNFTSASDIKFSDNLSTSFKNTSGNVTGWHLGVYSEIGVSILTFQPELLFAEKGFKSDQENGTVTVKYNYLDIPILVKFNPIPLVSIFSGPQVSIKLSDKISGPSDITSQINLNNLKDGDWGIVAGAGVKLSKLQIQGRYIWGLNDVTKEGASVDFKNQMFQISLGYKIF
ncbi:porin family protein [Solitalea koreensis]|uniref:Outer membrane protein beta-barrel domain-containing protein n=1 Tax=Solitalea koreensis TaxID=543615 RepID=A0A521AYB4_9SPHI|nr:porin family protein [Solitalea koreensis]SMO39828.1 Outer membrane protein beta-barrel domain-containing protein [Solitalea koreensis]